MGALGLVAIIAVLVWVSVGAMHRFDIHARTQYAVNGAMMQLRPLVDQFADDHARLPQAAELPDDKRKSKYPDGGGASIEDGGIIRIYFEKTPELKTGNLFLTPILQEKGGRSIEWKCTAEGFKSTENFTSTCKSRK
jgi:hypothetical protein